MSYNLSATNFVKGSLFEGYIKSIYKKANFRIIHITPTFKENSVHYNIESLKPDLKLEIPNSNLQFWIECKYRSYAHKKREYEIITEYQLQRHSELKDSPVYVFLGIGGKPNKPSYLYWIPISDCKPVMDIRYLRSKYQIN